MLAMNCYKKAVVRLSKKMDAYEDAADMLGAGDACDEVKRLYHDVAVSWKMHRSLIIYWGLRAEPQVYSAVG